jgi:hypothetical protein
MECGSLLPLFFWVAVGNLLKKPIRRYSPFTLSCQFRTIMVQSHFFRINTYRVYQNKGL